MATLCILDLIALIAVAAVGMWPDHADRVLTWHPVWVLSLATSYTGLVFAYFFFRAEFVRSKFATGMLFAFCGLLTLLSLIFETASRHWAAILEPHAGDVVFFQFAFTLIAAVSLVACSYRLREAQTVFEGYKSRMKQRFDTLAAMSLSHIAADLHSVQDNLGAASGTDRTVLGLQALPGASGSSPPADPAQPGAYGPGDRVFHVKFGYGRVTLVDGNKLTIEFEKIGERRVIDLFVRRV